VERLNRFRSGIVNLKPVSGIELRSSLRFVFNGSPCIYRSSATCFVTNHSGRCVATAAAKPRLINNCRQPGWPLKGALGFETKKTGDIDRAADLSWREGLAAEESSAAAG
jgi:hypothetical protein